MKIVDPKDIQIQFLNRINDLVPKETSLVVVLSDLLEISNDSAYRRMRGETMLTIEEIVTLCDHFNISFDAFSRKETGLVTFRYKLIEPQKENLLEYMKSILSDMQTIANCKNSNIIYACSDIPVFYHYDYPETAAFKLFYWMKSIMNIPELEKAKYDASVIDPELYEVAKNIITLYKQIPSIEIWTDLTIHSTIKQIEYYWEAGVFENVEDAVNICDGLHKLIADIQDKAEKTVKYDDGKVPDGKAEKNYELYHSDIQIINNSVLVNLDQTKAVYLSHFSFYTMSTMNDTYNEKTAAWLNSLIKRSVLISGVAEKQRYQFFKRMFQLIDDLKAKIIQAENSQS
jgi:hypothetical protein